MSDSLKSKPCALVFEGPVLLDIHESGIAHIRLNRPSSSNGMNTELLRALYEVIMRCHAERGVRAVLLTGEGKNFCAGGDVYDFADKGEKLADYLRQATSYLQIAASALTRLSAPVITAVQGFAAGGGGMGLVCSSDLVIAGRSSKFLAGATRVGMAPDAGVSVTLARLVGLRKATEILLTNPVIDAQQALELGLINRIADDEQLELQAWEWARELASGPPLALAATKRLLWSGLGLGMEACLPEESRTVSELSGTADAREGLAAVIERRKPVFNGC